MYTNTITRKVLETLLPNFMERTK